MALYERLPLCFVGLAIKVIGYGFKLGLKSVRSISNSFWVEFMAILPDASGRLAPCASITTSRSLEWLGLPRHHQWPSSVERGSPWVCDSVADTMNSALLSLLSYILSRGTILRSSKRLGDGAGGSN